MPVRGPARFAALSGQVRSDAVFVQNPLDGSLTNALRSRQGSYAPALLSRRRTLSGGLHNLLYLP